MTNRTVLIVDDSKIAGVTLGRVLEQHGLTVELAESGQDCLEFLRRNIPPGTIFLDHMMPGMDGFDVLRAIKANPQTTAIPVIMYTSREGQAYMGEAIAMGAYDVLAKPIKVMDLLRILRRLALIEDSTALRPASPAPAAREEEAASAGESTADRGPRAGEGNALAALLEQQGAAFRRDLAEGLQTLTERLERPTTAGRGAGTRRFAAVDRWQIALYLALLAVPLLWSLNLYRAAPHTPSEALPAADTARTPVSAVAARPADLRIDTLLDIIGWAANLSGQYEYNRAPLDDARLQVLRELLMRLSLANFRGTVRIDTHVAEFCLARSPNGERLLPDDDAPKERCEFLNLAPEQYVALGRRQSAAFTGFLQNSSLANSDAVNVQIVSHGRTRPQVDYPIFANIQTAGEWNRAARFNNRVEFSLIAREP